MDNWFNEPPRNRRGTLASQLRVWCISKHVTAYNCTLGKQTELVLALEDYYSTQYWSMCCTVWQYRVALLYLSAELTSVFDTFKSKGYTGTAGCLQFSTMKLTHLGAFAAMVFNVVHGYSFSDVTKAAAPSPASLSDNDMTADEENRIFGGKNAKVDKYP
ncbi:hypothetical protein ON010_g9641 [Phytophthora cinnamomi]|nr:hypothetical protein ON010_g9641 [Phytophthora cinnamomi]